MSEIKFFLKISTLLYSLDQQQIVVILIQIYLEFY